MADSGMSRVVNGSVSGVSSPRGTGSVQQNGGQARTHAGGEGASSDRSRSRTTQPQIINIDGKSFDRNAPRGTYLNILV